MKLHDGDKKSLIEQMKYMLTGLENCNYHLYTDNLYNSYSNYINLLNIVVYITGTPRKKRGGPDFMNIKRNTSVPKKLLYRLQRIPLIRLFILILE